MEKALVSKTLCEQNTCGQTPYGKLPLYQLIIADANDQTYLQDSVQSMKNHRLKAKWRHISE